MEENSIRKRRLISHVVVFMVIILFGYLGIVHTDKVYNTVINLKESVSSFIEHKSMAKFQDISDLKPLTDQTGAWYTKYHFISHGGGGVDGKTYTNCIEAWNNSYEKGNRVFDVDMDFTSDGHLVLRHAWSDGLETDDESMESGSWWIDDNGMYRNSNSGTIMSYLDFKKTAIFQHYTPLDCEDMLHYLQEHEDLYFSIDMKSDPIKSYEYLINVANKLNINDTTLDRIIVNLYDYDLYKPIKNIYDFKNITARQHAISPNNYYGLIRFCVENNIHVVNVSKCYMKDNEIKLFKKYGIHVYVAIIDYVSDMKNYHSLGADGAVTNWLYERDWKFVEDLL